MDRQPCWNDTQPRIDAQALVRPQDLLVFQYGRVNEKTLRTIEVEQRLKNEEIVTVEVSL